MNRLSLSVAGIALALLAGCGGGDDSPEQIDVEMDFDTAVDAGEPCDRLFEIRNQLDPHSPLIGSANERLRSIGCYSSGSERTDR